MIEQNVFGFEAASLGARVDRAVALLRECRGSVCLAYSGGKDSDVILHLARRAGISFEAMYHVTTFDPPEVVRHVRECGVWMSHPGTNYYREIRAQGLPTRWRRWCCRLFKEGKRWAMTTVLGVRAAESSVRAARWVEVQNVRRDRRYPKSDLVVAPIVGWSDDDVWRYIDENKIGVCSLYSEGFRRLGCIGCPMVRGSRVRDFARWPSVGRAIQRAFFQYQSGASAEWWWQEWVNDRFGGGSDEDGCVTQLDLWS